MHKLEDWYKFLQSTLQKDKKTTLQTTSKIHEENCEPVNLDWNTKWVKDMDEN